MCWAVFASGAHVDWDQSEQTVPGSKTTHRFRKRFRKREVLCYGFVDGVPPCRSRTRHATRRSCRRAPTGSTTRSASPPARPRSVKVAVHTAAAGHDLCRTPRGGPAATNRRGQPHQRRETGSHASLAAACVAFAWRQLHGAACPPAAPWQDIDWHNVRRFAPNPSVDDFLPEQCVMGGSWVVRQLGDRAQDSTIIVYHVPVAQCRAELGRSATDPSSDSLFQPIRDFRIL